MDVFVQLLKRHKSLVLAGVLSVTLGVTLLLMGQHPTSSPISWQVVSISSGGLSPGEEARDFMLSSTQGEKIGLAQLKGQHIGLAFVTATCPYCDKLATKLRSFNLATDQALLVICQGNREQAQRIEKAYSFAFPVLIDSTGVVNRAYKVATVPTVYLIDRTGTILNVATGWPSAWEQVQQLQDMSEGS